MLYMGHRDVTDEGSVKEAVCDELEANEKRVGVDEDHVGDFCSDREASLL